MFASFSQKRAWLHAALTVKAIFSRTVSRCVGVPRGSARETGGERRRKEEEEKGGVRRRKEEEEKGGERRRKEEKGGGGERRRKEEKGGERRRRWWWRWRWRWRRRRSGAAVGLPSTLHLPRYGMKAVHGVQGSSARGDAAETNQTSVVEWH
jgi:hypothetical protein